MSLPPGLIKLINDLQTDVISALVCGEHFLNGIRLQKLHHPQTKFKAIPSMWSIPSMSFSNDTNHFTIFFAMEYRDSLYDVFVYLSPNNIWDNFNISRFFDDNPADLRDWERKGIINILSFELAHRLKIRTIHNRADTPIRLFKIDNGDRLLRAIREEYLTYYLLEMFGESDPLVIGNQIGRPVVQLASLDDVLEDEEPFKCVIEVQEGTFIWDLLNNRYILVKPQDTVVVENHFFAAWRAIEQS